MYLTTAQTAAIRGALRTIAAIIEQPEPVAVPTGLTPLERFIREETYPAPGHSFTFAEMYERFFDWCPRNGFEPASKRSVASSMPSTIACGNGASNVKMIGNRSLTPVTTTVDDRPFVVIGGRLCRTPGPSRRKRKTA